jgi:indolepyruvate ferredoxin oxidoreductase
MNHAGTSAKGGVLLVAGDHGAYSSTLPHQSDHLFSASMIPVLYPCNVQEYLDLGIHGWAMSRFSGCTVAFKALADTVESSAVDANPFRVDVNPARLRHARRWPERPPVQHSAGQQARNQEALMQDYKIYAALAYARENKLNHTTIQPERQAGHHRLGQILSGRAGSAGRTGHRRSWRPNWVCACSKWPCHGRWSRTACARKVWTKFWWWKKNARSSNTSSRNSYTTGATTYVRA